MGKKKQIAFDFIFDYLYSMEIVTKPMFGCHGIYVGNKIMLVTRKKDNHEEANGIWIATSHEHHESLKKEIPSLTTVSILNEGKGETGWRMLHEDSEGFEESVIKICELIKSGDVRIGKVPKARKKKVNRVRK